MSTTATVQEQPVVVGVADLRITSPEGFFSFLKTHKLSRRKRVIVAGQRTWRNAKAIREALAEFVPEGAVVIENGARGATSTARGIAQLGMGHPVAGFPVPFKLDGKQNPMGPYANAALMVSLLTKGSRVIAFVDQKDSAPQTMDLCRLAYRAGHEVVLVTSRGSSMAYHRANGADLSKHELLALAEEGYGPFGDSPSE